MTLLYNAATFEHADTTHPETAKQAFRIVVPKPSTQILFGERIKRGDEEDTAILGTADGTRTNEGDVADFGYPGVSMQTEEAYFVNIKKTSVHQSGDSVTFQTKKDWTQYSDHHMYMSSKKKLYIASNRDMIISTDTAQGFQPVPNAGADLEIVDFDEHPADKLRSKIDNTMKVVTPEQEGDQDALSRAAKALSDAADAVSDAIETIREQTIAQLNPEYGLFLWQNKSAKAVEDMIKGSKTDLAFQWGIVAAPKQRHYAKRADGGGVLPKLKAFTAAIVSFKKSLFEFFPAMLDVIAEPLDALGTCWDTVMNEVNDLKGMDVPYGDKWQEATKRDIETQGDLDDDDNKNVPARGVLAARHATADALKPLKKAADVLDELDDLLEDMQYLVGNLTGELKPPMQIMSSGQLTIDSMREIDSFAANGYFFRSNRGGFGVRVRGQADLMGQQRAEVFSCGPTSVQGYQSLELLSAGPISLMSQKNSVEVIGKKIYIGSTKIEDCVRHALDAAVAGTTYDDEKRRTTLGSGVRPAQKADEYDAYVLLHAPAGKVLTSPYLPSDLREDGSQAGPTQTNPPQGLDAPPIDLKSEFTTSYQTTDYIQMNANVEQLLAVGHTETIKFQNGNDTTASNTGDETPIHKAKAMIRLMMNAHSLDLEHFQITQENRILIQTQDPGAVIIKVGQYSLTVSNEEVKVRYQGHEKLRIDADGVMIGKDDNKSLTFDSSGALLKGGSSSVKMVMSSSRTTFYGRTFLGN